MPPSIIERPNSVSGEPPLRQAIETQQATSFTEAKFDAAMNQSRLWFACGVGPAVGDAKANAASGPVLQGKGLVPDHRLIVSHVPEGRESSVTVISGCLGHVVPGVFCDEPPAVWTGLGRTAVHPGIRCLGEIPVILSNGIEVRAMGCRLPEADMEAVSRLSVPGADRYKKGRPSPAPVEPELLSAAATAQGLPVDLLFVYGTLRRGEIRHDLIRKHGGAWAGNGHVAGKLHDHGGFPGLVPEQGGMTFGEIYRFDDIAAALQSLDMVEGFMGYGQGGSLFRRTLMDIRTLSGETFLSWVYVICRPSGVRIPSDDWVKHRKGVRA